MKDNAGLSTHTFASQKWSSPALSSSTAPGSNSSPSFPSHSCSITSNLFTSYHITRMLWKSPALYHLAPQCNIAIVRLTQRTCISSGVLEPSLAKTLFCW